MDPYVCCLLGLCCPPNSPEQIQKLGAMLIARDVCKEQAEAEKIAKFHVDLVQQVRDALKSKA
jgi:hypothetical protein